MTGGIMPKLFAMRWIMPKLFAMRWPIGICAALLLLSGAIGFATTLTSRGTDDSRLNDDFAGERQQLLFFKAALGRIDEELRDRRSTATPSLRSEREAVLRRMQEVASRMPPERLPADIAVLLRPVPAAAAAAAPAPPSQRAAPPIEVRRWQTGLGTRYVEIDLSDLVLDAPSPLPVYIERPQRRAEQHRDGEPGEKTAERPARRRPAKDKERSAAEKPAKEQSAPEHVAKPRTPERPADRPPVTVQRTAIAAPPEARQPAQ
jgi:hypothetical protein